MTRLRVGLVGLGLAVEPHAKSLLDLEEDVEVRWAAAPSRERTEAFAKAFPFPVTNNVDAVLSDPEVDAILLLTPPGTHLELGRRCLANGKHLLIEKPLELTAAKAGELVDAAKSVGRKLGVMLQHRFHSSTLRAAELIGSGALGQIEAATVAVPWWRPQSYYDEPGRGTLARDGGGVLLTQAIHTLDVFRALVGVRSVTAAHIKTTSLHRMEMEDLAIALVELGNGSPGSILATTAAYPGRTAHILIIGSAGSLEIRGDAWNFQALDGTSETQEVPEGSSAGANPMAFSHEGHRAVIADFADAIAGDRTPKVSGEDALATQRLIENIRDAARIAPPARK